MVRAFTTDVSDIKKCRLSCELIAAIDLYLPYLSLLIPCIEPALIEWRYVYIQIAKETKYAKISKI